MQQLKPWRALLLLAVLCQPGTSDRYGKMILTEMMLRVKAQLNCNFIGKMFYYFLPGVTMSGRLSIGVSLVLLMAWGDFTYVPFP